MSAISALANVRTLEDRLGIPEEDAFELAPRTVSDLSLHDYSAARDLRHILSGLKFEDLEADIREALNRTLHEQRPSWFQAFIGGRKRVELLLEPNQRQVFRNGGLLANDPSEEAIRWWDRWAAEGRTARDLRLSAIGREAERRSFELEVARLADLKCPQSPRWVALDDPGAGFDIETYEIVGDEWVEIAIEVKSSAASPMGFFLSRNEFDTCRRMSDRYLVHLWGTGRQAPVVVPGRTLIDWAPMDGLTARWTEAYYEPPVNAN